MTEESLEAAFKDFWETTYKDVTDPVVHRAIRDAFLSGAGHVTLSLAEVGYERGILAAKRLVDQWSKEMDGLVAATTPQRLVRRVPDVPGGTVPD